MDGSGAPASAGSQLPAIGAFAQVPVPASLEDFYFIDPPTARQLNRFYAELGTKLLQIDGDLGNVMGRMVAVETTTARQAEVAASVL